MKILFLHDKYSETGGAEKCIELERKQYEKIGDKTFLFTTSDDPSLELKNSKIIFAKKYGLLGSYGRAFKVYKELKKYIDEIRPDLIYIHNNYEYPFSFLAAAKGHKTIQKTHDFGVICPSRWCVYKDNFKPCDGKMGIKCMSHGCVGFKTFLSSFLKINYIKNNATVEKFVSPSKNLQNFMIKNGFKKVSFKENPFEIYAGKGKIKRNKNLFLYVGGLYLHKGVPLIIEAAKIAFKKKPGIIINIIGEGPEENNLKTKAKKYGLEKNVIFLGRVKNNFLYKYYKEASATIFPSIWMENAPYVVKESLFFKTPVIAGDINAKPSLLVSVFKHNDAGSLAKKILEISRKNAPKNKGKN